MTLIWDCQFQKRELSKNLLYEEALNYGKIEKRIDTSRSNDRRKKSYYPEASSRIRY